MRTALVTGANRGIGLEVARQLAAKGLAVILTARDVKAGAEAALDLRTRGLAVDFEHLDVSEPRSIEACAARLLAAGRHVDVLVNNAGIYPDGGVLDTTPDVFRATMEINFFGAVATCRAFVPAMIRAGYGRVVNVTSGYGSFGEGLEGPAAYSISKAALDALTLKLSREVRGDVKVNAACPGWVRTRMGGANADASVEEGADTIVWLATLSARGPNGAAFRDRAEIPW